MSSVEPDFPSWLEVCPPGTGPVHGHQAELCLRVGDQALVTVPIAVGDDHPDTLRAAHLALQLVSLFAHYDDLRDLAVRELGFALTDVRALGRLIRAFEEQLILLAHENAGASWGQLGKLLGTNRQSAKERFLRIAAARLQGLTTDGASEVDAERDATDEAHSLTHHKHHGQDGPGRSPQRSAG